MRSSVLFYAGCEDFTNNHQSHFLEACCLCQKLLGKNNDIFMYRGNTPFCSQECRQEQIEIDEAQERRNWKLAKKALRQKAAFATTETTEASEKSSRTGTVAVA